jgi:hypothetical protein
MMPKSCIFRGSEIVKKGLFRMFSQNSGKLIFKQKWCTKRSVKRPKEVKKRGNLIEKHYFFYFLLLHVLKVG